MTMYRHQSTGAIAELTEDKGVTVQLKVADTGEVKEVGAATFKRWWKPVEDEASTEEPTTTQNETEEPEAEETTTEETEAATGDREAPEGEQETEDSDEGFDDEDISNEKRDELISLSKPLMDLLCENQHLHSSINVTVNGILLADTVVTIGFDSKHKMHGT